MNYALFIPRYFKYFSMSGGIFRGERLLSADNDVPLHPKQIVLPYDNTPTDVTLRRQQKAESTSSNNSFAAALTTLQQQILNLMRENPKITTTELIAATGMKKTAIYNNIRKLKDARLLSQDPDGTWHTP